MTKRLKILRLKPNFFFDVLNDNNCILTPWVRTRPHSGLAGLSTIRVKIARLFFNISRSFNEFEHRQMCGFDDARTSTEDN